MGWIFKLVSGDKSLDLYGGALGSSGYNVRDASLNAPPGETQMSLTLNYHLEAAGAVDAARALEAQIAQYMQWAEAYEQQQRDEPVELWVGHDDGIGIEPTFGLGFKRRRIKGGKIVAPFAQPTPLLKAPVIPGITLNMTCEPYWHSKTHWLLCGIGGIIENETDQGVEVWRGTTNLCEAPSRAASWTALAGATLSELGVVERRQYGAPYRGETAIRCICGSSELLSNGGFETAGSGGADVFADWYDGAGDGTIVQTTTAGEYRSGAAAAKLTAGASYNTYVSQDITVIPGAQYALSFWTRGDGTYAGRYQVRDITNSANIISTTTTEVTGATFTQINATITAPAGCTTIRLALRCPSTNGGWACFDDVSIVPASAGLYRDEVSGAPLAISTYTLSAYVRGRGGSIGQTVNLEIEERGGATAAQKTTATATLTADWQRVVVTHAIVQADRTDLRIQAFCTGIAANDEWHIDAIQLEQLAYATPYCDGTLGLGHAWTGTAEQSASTRAYAKLYGSAGDGVVNPSAGTVSMWVKNMDWNDGINHYLFDTSYLSGATNRIGLYRNSSNLLVAYMYDAQGTVNATSYNVSAFTDANWYHIALTWERNGLRLYINGSAVGTPDTSCDTPTVLSNTFYVGCVHNSILHQANCIIHSDFRLYNVALTAAQIANLYRAGRGPGIMPYIASLEAGSITDPPTILIHNHQDSAHQGWALVGNVPGDLEAPTEWWAQFAHASLTYHMGRYWYGFRRWEGDKWALHFDANDDASTFPAITTAVADTNCAGGYKARVTPINNTWNYAFQVYPGYFRGRFRCFLRVYDGASALGVFKICAQLYNSVGGSSPIFPDIYGVSAPALNTWCVVDLGEFEMPMAAWQTDPRNPATLRNILRFYVMLETGSDVSLDCDQIWIVPADCYGFIGSDFPLFYSTAGAHQNAIGDNPSNYFWLNDTFYHDTYGEIAAEEEAGHMIYLVPRQKGRFILFNINADTHYEHSISSPYDSMFVAMRLQPRYLTPW